MAQEQRILRNPSVSTNQAKHILELVYPVGTYYSSSEEIFDPNESFVGTWELDEERSDVENNLFVWRRIGG